MDPARRVLLVHFDFADDETPHGLWACPGGGIDPGESPEDAVRRELLEETGLLIDDPGTAVWRKEHVFAMSSWDGQQDTYFLVEVDAFEPRPHFTDAELRAEHLDQIRWWAYDELMAAQRSSDVADPGDPDRTVFSPRRLGHLVTDLLTGGRPAVVIDVSGR